jgi:hypothetical protein
MMPGSVEAMDIELSRCRGVERQSKGTGKWKKKKEAEDFLWFTPNLKPCGPVDLLFRVLSSASYGSI